jgi:hypothetical protein
MLTVLEILVDTFCHGIEIDTEVKTLAIVDNTGIHQFGELS